MNKRLMWKQHKIQDLFELADTGAPRPKVGTVLGNALGNYTSANSKSFDPEFGEIIRERRPDWFGRQATLRLRDNTPPEEAKRRMIAMALRREDLTITHPWYHRLRRYTNPKSKSFDGNFTKVILLLAPSWSERSVGRTGDAAANKQAILLAASAGWDKPSRKTKMGQVLSTYTSVGHESYDGIFLSRLMSLRPDWFGIALCNAA